MNYNEKDLLEMIENNTCETGEFELISKIEKIDITNKIVGNSGEEYVYDITVEDNENFMVETGLFIHNSRAGDQVPFSSVNVGLDTSEAGRLVTKKLIQVFEKGFTDGGIFIYPIIIFHCLDGVSYHPTDPNYDLFVLGMKSSSKRFYPNYNFLNSPFQYQYLRDKRGRLLWKAREDWYVEKGLIDKDEMNSIGVENEPLENNLILRIREVNKLEAKLRRNYKENKNIIFDTAKFVNGDINKTIANRANNRGYQYPVGDDSLLEGLDDRTVAARMGCVDKKETITLKIKGEILKDIPIKEAYDIIREFSIEEDN